MSTDSHTLRAGGIAATIKADGAELCSLQNADGVELLWQAGPEWPRHAPLLFPIVGRLKDDKLLHRGQSYPMTQHGFARDLPFAWKQRAPDNCTLELTDSEATRARYPFAFRLTVGFRVTTSDLEVAVTVTNTGDEILPASVGAHPAFKWPLSPELPKQAYQLVFSNDEPAPIRRLKGGLMRLLPEATPIAGKTLALSEQLFDDDAVILDEVASHSVRYAADRGPSIDVSWEGYRELGIWSKLGGAPFLCIEPWRGFASPVDFDGEFIDKPGLMHIAPGANHVLKYRIRVG